MKVLIADTYYPAYLASVYAKLPGLASSDYGTQLDALLDECFGTSDFYSRHLNALGVDTRDLIVNCVPLQAAWARQAGHRFLGLLLRVPPQVYRLPVVGRAFAALPGLLDIAAAQVREFKPDVFYSQNLSFFPPQALRKLKSEVKLIVGQIASPLPPNPFLLGYDLILTSFPHFVPRLRALGIASEFFRIGFEPRVLQKLGSVSKDVEVSFVGGISRHHAGALRILEHLAATTPIQFFGYGADTLDVASPIRPRHHGEVWGLDMYRALARSRITVNRHIDVAENHANNMRLYEATGVGTLLITDRKDNLGEIFDVGKEVLAYDGAAEAADLIRYFLTHPAEQQAIAKAGQSRTMRDHTYRQRMEELVAILGRYL
jgi:hypothetical protein